MRPMDWDLHENLMELCRVRARVVGFRRGFIAGMLFGAIIVLGVEKTLIQIVRAFQ